MGPALPAENKYFKEKRILKMKKIDLFVLVTPRLPIVTQCLVLLYRLYIINFLGKSGLKNYIFENYLSEKL